MRAATDGAWLSERGGAALWYAFLGAPLIWFLELVVSYPLVPYACWSGNTWPLYALQIAALLGIIGSGVVGYSLFTATGAQLPGDHATRTDRTRMMAVIGIMFSAGFALLLISHVIATAVVGPCIPVPREPLSPDTFLAPEGRRVLAALIMSLSAC